MSLISFFESLPGKIKELLVKVFGESAVEQAEADIKTILQADVVTIFQDGIAYASTLQVSDTDKRTAAFDKIKTDLAAAGKQFTDHIINLGIELVFSMVKGKTV